MKIGAGPFVRNWGSTMSLVRDGTTIVSSFKGRMVHQHITPDYQELNESVDQVHFLVIADADQFGAVVPRKFDVITLGSDTYTVQSMRAAGADETELFKMFVKGGNP